MDKRDLLPLILALVIVIVLAIVVKPMMTGDSAGYLSFLQNDSQEVPTVPTPKATPIAPPPTAPPAVATPTPRWDGNVQDVGFVDPATYHLNSSEFQPKADIPGTSPPDERELVTYATISGKWSGSTEIISVPFPYWEMQYTVTTLTEPGLVFPSINIQVMDADDPNRFVRIVNPGVLDPNLWEVNDPRPWTEKFFEGERNYYFVITTRFISSYRIDILVPKKFTGE
jgi:hypothetical protein